MPEVVFLYTVVVFERGNNVTFRGPVERDRVIVRKTVYLFGLIYPFF